jgi:hypothetical protein
MSTSEPIFAVYIRWLVSDPRRRTGERPVYPYLKGDVIIGNADLELLLSNDVLFWPIRVVFPLCAWRGSGIHSTAFGGLRTL